MSGNTTALAACAPRLAALIPRLASDFDGEIIPTVHAIRRLLAAEGSDLHDLAGILTSKQRPLPVESPERRPSWARYVPPDRVNADNWREVVDYLQNNLEAVTDWERDFLTTLHRFPRLSTKQRN